MIISEKQVLELLTIAKNAMGHSCYLHTQYSRNIAELVDKINSQQSDELKDISDE
jgi:hypothetical protein